MESKEFNSSTSNVQYAVSMAKQQLRTHENVSVNLTVIKHEGKRSARLQSHVNKTGSGDPLDRVEAQTEDLNRRVDDVVHTALSEIDDYYGEKRFGTGTVVINRKGNEIEHTDTLIDERILSPPDGWGNGRKRTFRIKRPE